MMTASGGSGIPIRMGMVTSLFRILLRSAWQVLVSNGAGCASNDAPVTHVSERTPSPSTLSSTIPAVSTKSISLRIPEAALHRSAFASWKDSENL